MHATKRKHGKLPSCNPMQVNKRFKHSTAGEIVCQAYKPHFTEQSKPKAVHYKWQRVRLEPCDSSIKWHTTIAYERGRDKSIRPKKLICTQNSWRLLEGGDGFFSGGRNNKYDPPPNTLYDIGTTEPSNDWSTYLHNSAVDNAWKLYGTAATAGLAYANRDNLTKAINKYAENMTDRYAAKYARKGHALAEERLSQLQSLQQKTQQELDKANETIKEGEKVQTAYDSLTAVHDALKAQHDELTKMNTEIQIELDNEKNMNAERRAILIKQKTLISRAMKGASDYSQFLHGSASNGGLFGSASQQYLKNNTCHGLNLSDINDGGELDAQWTECFIRVRNKQKESFSNSFYTKTAGVLGAGAASVAYAPAALAAIGWNSMAASAAAAPATTGLIGSGAAAAGVAAASS